MKRNDAEMRRTEDAILGIGKLILVPFLLRGTYCLIFIINVDLDLYELYSFLVFLANLQLR